MVTEDPAAGVRVPPGGGSLREVSEQFTPDLQTGTGGMRVPLSLPPGRGGFGPQLVLTYSSGYGNGPFGLGWRLQLPGVARQTAHGFPSYGTDDVFLLSAGEELVEVATGAGRTTYRLAAEGPFARIAHVTAGQDDVWEVRDRDGSRTEYGTPRARWGALPFDPAVLADPAGRPFAWQPSRSVDRFGNVIEYDWTRTGEAAGTSGAVPPTVADAARQQYLTAVRWLDHGDRDVPEFMAEVRLHYEERPDAFTDARAGFLLQTGLRCTHVEVFSGEDHSTPVRVYDLRYAGQDGTPAPANGVSLLLQVRCRGVDGARTEHLPPLTFGYTPFEPQRARVVAASGEQLPAVSFRTAGIGLVDLFGSGRPDLVQVGAQVRYWRNRGAGRFEAPRVLARAPDESARPGGLLLADADGDGLAELLAGEEPAGWYRLDPARALAPQGFERWSRAPTFRWDDPQVRLTDLNRDGVADVLRTDGRLECFIADPRQGWRQAASIDRRQFEGLPDVAFDDPRLRLADMSGDGSDALVLVHAGRVDYWPLRGPARWGPRVTMRSGPRLPDRFDPRRVLLGDVDGDGTADLVYVGDGAVTLWLNRSGRSWSDPIEITGTPRVADGDLLSLVDLLGTGVRGVLWSTDAAAPGRDPVLFLDLTADSKPYLLTEVDNGLGSTTRITYAPSTQFRTADEHRRATRWRTTLPFPVHVVRDIVTEDQVTGMRRSTRLSYRHGYWDGRDREFRGFARVERVDREEQVSGGPPIGPVTRLVTWFHVGPVAAGRGDWNELDLSGEFWWGDPAGLERPQAQRTVLAALSREGRRLALRALRGRVLRTELFDLDGSDREDRPYEVTEHLHGVLPVNAGTAATTSPFFPHVLAERTTTWERGDDPMTRLSLFQGYDAYGRCPDVVEVAVPRGRDWRGRLPAASTGGTYLATRTRTRWSDRDDATAYLADRPCVVTRADLDVAGWEAANSASPSAVELGELATDGPLGEHVIDKTVTRYDGAAFEGLQVGQVGRFGVPTRVERLVMDDDLLDEALADAGGTTWRPPYLTANPATSAWSGYPAEFAPLTPALAGFVARNDGLYACVQARRYDVHDDPDAGRGLVVASRDPLGNETVIEYDDAALVPVVVRDPAGLETTAEYDLRLLAPTTVTDPNGNRQVMSYTPLGLLESVWVRGRTGEDVGDPPSAPGTSYTWNLTAFADTGAPAGVRTVRRVRHATDATATAAELAETVQTYEYWDGTGRVVQTRSSADPLLPAGAFPDLGLPVDLARSGGPVPGPAGGDAPRVRVGGRQVRDHAGRTVESFEPFFDEGWDYAEPPAAATRSRTRMRYDARGVLVAVTNPDGSQRTVVRGIPPSGVADPLADPAAFAPSPWEIFSYDESDNGGRTHPTDPAVTAQDHCWNTPSSVVVDPLARPIARTERLRRKVPGGGVSAMTELRTMFRYDARGNVVAVDDPMGRPAVRSVFSLTDLPLRVEALDGGLRRSVHDAAGDLLERRDGKGAWVLEARDVLRRPIRRWGSNGGEALTLRERVEYGDTGSAAQPAAERSAQRALNRLGRPAEQYDEAGRVVVDRYDHTGVAVERVRHVLAASVLLTAAATAIAQGQRVEPYRTDWTPRAGTTLADRSADLLDPTPYPVTQALDALGRPLTLTGPPAADGTGRPTLRWQHEPGGRPRRITLNGVAHLADAAYDARGEPLLLVLPDAASTGGVLRRWTYDSVTGRARRLRSERYRAPAPGSTARYDVADAASPLQDAGYRHTLSGDVAVIDDRTPSTGAAGVGTLFRTMTYDSLARLVGATARECLPSVTGDPWAVAPACGDPATTRASTETYEYDDAGNLTLLRRDAGAPVSSTQIALAAGTNRVATATVAGTSYAYTYDGAGNLTGETASRHFDHDHLDRLRSFAVQVRTATSPGQPERWAEPSQQVQYLLGADGGRVLRVVRLQGGAVETTVELDGVFEDHAWTEAAGPQRASRTRVRVGARQVAAVRAGPPPPDDAAAAVQRRLEDHVGSTTAVLDAAGTVLFREEYSAYGTTIFGGGRGASGRFTGRNRDSASGLADHGARWYAPWLGRWTSRDPAGPTDHLNPYVYARNNPVSRTDVGGTRSWPADVTDETAPDPVGEAGGLGMGSGTGPPDAVAAPPSEPAQPATTPADPEEPTLLLRFFRWVFDVPDPVPATPTPPPPPPPAVPGDVYRDESAFELIEPGEAIQPWQTVYRRTPTAPDTWAVERSQDGGLTWEPTGRTIWRSDTPPVDEQTLEDARASEERMQQIAQVVGGVIVGVLVGAAVGFAFIVAMNGALSALGSSSRIGVPGWVMAAAGFSVILSVLSVQYMSEGPPPERPVWRYGSWTIRGA
jgi:RHS repeat-associated protein